MTIPFPAAPERDPSKDLQRVVDKWPLPLRRVSATGGRTAVALRVASGGSRQALLRTTL